MRVDGSNMEVTLQGVPRPPTRSAAEKPSAGGTSEPVDVMTLSSDAVLRITNEALEKEYGAKIAAQFADVGVDLSEYTGMDWSPEATAKRIFDFSSGLLETWRGQNPELEEGALIDSFEETIRGAVEEGYESAVGTLEGMGVGDEVLSVSKKTMSELSRLFDEFFANLREGPEPDDEVKADTA